MKKAIRFLALFLVLSLVTQMLPLTAIAKDTEETTIHEIEKLVEGANDNAVKPGSENEARSSALVIGEIPELRGESQKHFRMADGSYIAVDYGMPVHFTNDAGETWEEIDNSLVLSEPNGSSRVQSEDQKTAEKRYTAENGDSTRNFARDLHTGFLFSAQTGNHGLRISLSDTEASSFKESANEVTDARSAVEAAGIASVETASPAVEAADIASVEIGSPATETTGVASVETASPVIEANGAASVETGGSPCAETTRGVSHMDYNSSATAEISYPDSKITSDERGSSVLDTKSFAKAVARAAAKANGEEKPTGTESAELSIAEQVAPAKLRADVLYRNVYKDVDLSYELCGYDVKETILIHQPLDSYSFTFYMDLGRLTPVLMKDGSIELRDERDKVAYLIPAPYMFDAAGASSDAAAYTLSKTASGSWAMTVTADERWINADERVFPVSIDPTVIDKITWSGQWALLTLIRVSQTRPIHSIRMCFLDTPPITARRSSRFLSAGIICRPFRPGARL